MKIFGFPFAGGSSYSLNFLKSLLEKETLFSPIELPGRGKKLQEPIYTDIEVLVDIVFQEIKHELIFPYAFYGHSMGTVLSYLLIKKIQKENLPLPLLLFISGRGGPSMILDEIRYNLPKIEFWKAVKELGGSPDEVIENEDLRDFFEPILRADFQALETYKYKSSEPFNTPITVLLGKEDKVTDEEARLWQKETTVPIDIHYFDGGHFFIFDHAKEIADLMMKKISIHKR